jgi:Flp pilus assembly protein TadG
MGASTVEFAMTASVFFMILMASIEFTRFMFVRNSVDQAAYEACRFGIVPGRTAAEVRTQAEAFLSRVGIVDRTIEITPSVIDSSTRQVTVDIQANFAKSSWITPMFTRNCTIRSTVVLDHENLAALLANR